MTDGFLFSAELIERTIAYYERLGVSIDEVTAQEYLRSMSKLYKSLMDFVAIPVQRIDDGGEA
jgi:hypothetical protein